jgi:hypothetical protein
MPFPATLLDPPATTTPHRSTTKTSEAHVQQIIDHFNVPNYDLPLGEVDPSSPTENRAPHSPKKGHGHGRRPSMSEKRAPLSEREMMYLVSRTVWTELWGCKDNADASFLPH